MADAWGGSWDVSWGVSWGITPANARRGDIIVRDNFKHQRRLYFRQLQEELDRHLTPAARSSTPRRKNVPELEPEDDLPSIVFATEAIPRPDLNAIADPIIRQQLDALAGQINAAHMRRNQAEVQRRLERMAEEMMLRDDEDAIAMMIMLF